MSIVFADFSWIKRGGEFVVERKEKFEKCMISTIFMDFIFRLHVCILMLGDIYFLHGLFNNIVWISEQELASLRITVDQQIATNESLKKMKVSFLFSSPLYKTFSFFIVWHFFRSLLHSIFEISNLNYSMMN